MDVGKQPNTKNNTQSQHVYNNGMVDFPTYVMESLDLDEVNLHYEQVFYNYTPPLNKDDIQQN